MRRTFWLLSLLLMIIFTGCSSLSTWVKSNLEGVPVWVFEPQVGRNQTAFVGEGRATAENRARVLAYESILTEISTYIGEDVTGRHIAQLSSRGAVEEYLLRVTQEFVKQEDEVVTVWFLAVADRTLLETARTESEIQLLENVRRMDELAALGSRYYRENKDILAVQQYLGIAGIARTLPVDRGEQRRVEALDRVRTILRPLTISVTQGNPAIPTVEVRHRRGSGRLSPRVVQAPVTAMAQARDGMGSEYADSQRFVTDANGQFTFRSTNPTLVSTGSIVFGLDLEHDLAPIKESDPEVHGELVSLLEQKRVGFPYARVSIVGNQPLLIAVQEYTLQGAVLPSSFTAQSFAKRLSNDGIRTQVSGIPPLEDEDQLSRLRSAYPSVSFALYGDVGVSHQRTTERGGAVTVTGEVSLVDMSTFTRLGSTQTVVANAVGPSMEEARREAFSRFGLIATSLLYRYLYR
ncbi:MAG: hypothetical protein PHN93_00165 [Sphaerochaetaceae bacterium]|nr:hypothetical protein [Sphaerochaetaceae bacterium]